MGKKHKKKDIICQIGSSEIKRTGSIDLCSKALSMKSQDDGGIPDELWRKGPGVFFGRTWQPNDGKYIGMRQGEDGHIAVIGGSGSGKTCGIVKPTLKTWQGAICATDVKGELTEHYRHLFWSGGADRPYIAFDPTDANSPSYDPFWWPSMDDEGNLTSNMEDIAFAIFPDLPDVKEPFWNQAERRIFTAALLYFYQLGLSFSEAVCKIMNSTASKLCKKLAACQEPRIKMYIGEGDKLKPETIACIDQGLRNKLQVFAVDPYVSHAFRGQREGAECFTWNDLETSNIFLHIPEEKINSWGRAINLMYAQLFHYLMRRPEKHSWHGRSAAPTLLLLDEFPRLGKIEGMADGLATLRSKNVNICLVMQSIAQLDKIYGPVDRRVIMNNCQFVAILRANDAETQDYLCQLIGSQLYLQHSVSETLDEDMSIIGYSRQLSEVRDRKIHSHELSTLEDVLLLTPYGFCHVEKELPPLMAATQKWPTGLGRLSSTLAPMDVPLPSPKESQGVRRLTIKERLIQANKLAADTEYQQAVNDFEDSALCS